MLQLCGEAQQRERQGHYGDRDEHIARARDARARARRNNRQGRGAQNGKYGEYPPRAGEAGLVEACKPTVQRRRPQRHEHCKAEHGWRRIHVAGGGGKREQNEEGQAGAQCKAPGRRGRLMIGAALQAGARPRERRAAKKRPRQEISGKLEEILPPPVEVAARIVMSGRRPRERREAPREVIPEEHP